MGMPKKYRIPTLREMQTQGFKFQWLDIRKYRMIFIDFSNPNPEEDRKTPWIVTKHWRDNKVWWHHEPMEMITTTLEDGTTFTQIGRSINFFYPWSDEHIQRMIDRKEIRCLI